MISGCIIEIGDGKSITYMIAGLNKEYGDVVESGLLFADPAVVDRETDELIEKQLLSNLRIDSNTNKKLDGIMSLLLLNAHWL